MDPPSHLPTVTVGFGRAVDMHASLATLGRWGDDLIDRWDGNVLVRSLRRARQTEPIAWTSRVTSGPMDHLVVEHTGPVSDAAVADAVRATFVAEDGPLRELAGRDARVAALAARHPGLVPVLFPDPFAALVRSISAQQVNLTWAATVRARIARRYGRRLQIGDSFVYRLEPATVAATSVEALRELQLTTAKARSVIATARAAHSGELEINELQAWMTTRSSVT